MRKYLTLLFFILSFDTNAFSLNNTVAAAFVIDDVTVNVSSKSCVAILDRTPNDIMEMAQEAVERFWNTVPTSRLKLKIGGLVSVSPVFATDSLCSSNTTSCTVNEDLLVRDQILIACNRDSSTQNFNGNKSVLALGLPNNIEGTNIRGAVVLLNDIPGSNLINYEREQFISVLAHEIGHAIGLGHSPVEDSLMFYKNHPNRKYLGLDDMDGVSYLYPREQPVGCGTIKSIHDQSGNGPFLLSFIVIVGFIFVISRVQKKRMANCHI